MNREGHVGFTLAVVGSILYLLDLVNTRYFMVLMLSAVFSILPDIDLRLEIAHRKYTHNIFIALSLSIAIGLLLHLAGLDFIVGFTSCLAGLLSHIAGDLLTYMEFPPLWPLVKKEVSLKLFKSNSKPANKLFLALGIAVLIAYALKMVKT